MEPNVAALIRNKMKARGLENEVIEDFIEKARTAYGQSAFIPLLEVQAPGPDLIFEAQDDSDGRSRLERRGVELLNQLVVVKLNGGRSTTMGGQVPKGILIAKDGLSYLEIVFAQIKAIRKVYGSRTPLALMNSFFTHGPTMEIVDRTGTDVLTLIQSQVPRLIEDNFAPLETGTEEDWVPPGHGDLYESLRRSGLLDRLIQGGYRWAFISNLDNLAACVEPWILAAMEKESIDFLLEVTDRTNADRKGGTPVVRNGRLQLLEIAQVAPDDRALFQDIHRFPFFNTNNVWIDLQALSSALSQGALDLPIMQNSKTIAGFNVIQLETAMGAALGCFPGAKALRVGRERFFPTKKIADLMILGSDACVLDSMNRLCRNPLRPDSLPFMPEVFFAEDFLDSPLAVGSRFEDPNTLSLLRADSLDVFGSVFFESNVTVEGRVEIRDDKTGVYRVSRGTLLRDGRYPPLNQQYDGLTASSSVLYPMELSRLVVEKVWGSASIEWALPREMQSVVPIGELWETFDGRDEGSVILNGPYRRKSMSELIRELGSDLVGQKLIHYVDRRFPLLIKYLFP
jgi:UTP--glucose-1-phosphate uridylyltransferase